MSGSKRATKAAWMLGICALALWAVGTIPVNNSGYFELDANIADDPAKDGVDWTVVNAGPVAGGIRTGVLGETNGTTIYTGGGSKDTNGIGQWMHTSGAVPDKDNITNAYAYAKIVNGELLIFFGADRFTTEGNANFGFWFFQQNVAPAAGGKFTGAHTDGDLLVVAGYEQGGKTPVIEVFKWVGNDATGHLELLYAQSGATSALCNPAGPDQYVCGVTNSVAQNIGPANGYNPAWNYQDKDGNTQVIPVNAFFEGGINVSHFFTGEAPCFTSFLAETRSSTSETAQLKDFIAGGFPICGLSLTKGCPAAEWADAAHTAVKYTIAGTVTNTGVGAIYNVKVVDTPNGSTPIEVAVGTVAAGATVPWGPAYYTVASTGWNNYAYATGTVASDPASAPVTSDTVGPIVCSFETNANLTITKTCNTVLEQKNSYVVVKVEFNSTVTNSGDVQLKSLSFADDPTATFTTTLPTVLNPGQSANISGYYYPTNWQTATPLGRYFFDDTIKVTSAVPVLGPPLDDEPGCGTGVKKCKKATCPICPPGGCQLNP